MMGTINGLLTLLLIIIFIGICLWAWSKHNVEKFERMAQLPLEDDESSFDQPMREVVTDE